MNINFSEILTTTAITIFSSSALVAFIAFLLRESIRVFIQTKSTLNIEEYKAIETRLNLHTSNYIQTVTNQRIAWLEKMREDLSQVVSGYRIIYHHSNLADAYHKSTIISVLSNNIDKEVKEHYIKEYFIRTTYYRVRKQRNNRPTNKGNCVGFPNCIEK